MSLRRRKKKKKPQQRSEGSKFKLFLRVSCLLGHIIWIWSLPVHHDARSDGLSNTLEFDFLFGFLLHVGHGSSEGHGEPVAHFVWNTVGFHLGEHVVFTHYSSFLDKRKQKKENYKSSFLNRGTCYDNTFKLEF